MTISQEQAQSFVLSSVMGEPLFRAPSFTPERRVHINDIKARLAAGNGTPSTEYRTFYHMLSTAICELSAEPAATPGAPDSLARLEMTAMRMITALSDIEPNILEGQLQ